MLEDELELLEVSVGDHAIGLVENYHVDHREAVEEVGLHVLVHELPEAAGRGDYYGRLVGEQSLLLLDGHSANECAGLDLVFVVDWNDLLNHVSDLQCKLPGW